MERRIQRQPAYLGILVCEKEGPVPFKSHSFYQQLTVAGRKAGIEVYVFTPDWIDWEERRVRAYAYDPASGEWSGGSYPLPRLIYDRGFFRTRRQLRRHRVQIAKLRNVRGVQMLGLGLGGKLDVYKLLSGEESLTPFLPRTERYAGSRSLSRWLREEREVLLKPQGGTHGKGIFRITRRGPYRYEAIGRSRSNRITAHRFGAYRELADWVDATLVGGKPYLLQRYLSLTTPQGEPFDIRALVQKNGDGRWSFTGAAARVGAAGGLTSNLHGGGKAQAAESFLIEHYGEQKALNIMRQIRQTALTIPPVLESGHGPLLELGIDFGVDRLGRIWVLEVNSKPGRTSFARLPDKMARIAAVTSPIRYARYVLDRQLGGQINGFDVKQDTFYEKNG